MDEMDVVEKLSDERPRSNPCILTEDEAMQVYDVYLPSSPPPTSATPVALPVGLLVVRGMYNLFGKLRTFTPSHTFMDARSAKRRKDAVGAILAYSENCKRKLFPLDAWDKLVTDFRNRMLFFLEETRDGKDVHSYPLLPEIVPLFDAEHLTKLVTEAFACSPDYSKGFELFSWTELGVAKKEIRCLHCNLKFLLCRVLEDIGVPTSDDSIELVLVQAKPDIRCELQQFSIDCTRPSEYQQITMTTYYLAFSHWLYKRSLTGTKVADLPTFTEFKKIARETGVFKPGLFIQVWEVELGDRAPLSPISVMEEDEVNTRSHKRKRTPKIPWSPL